MEATKRMSMNTILKNANLFDDDSLDEDSLQPRDPSELSAVFSGSPTFETETVRIKQEIKKEFSSDDEEESTEISIKQEVCIEKIKQETKEEPGTNGTNHLLYATPVKQEIKSEPAETPDPSPFNKEAFHYFHIESPAEDNKSSKNTPKEDLRKIAKTAKRTVFNRYMTYENNKAETRQSVKERLGPPPQKEHASKGTTESKRMSVKKRLGPSVTENETPSKKNKKKEMESDPEILARRQKQIDYGKNTLGYDNYIKTVPKEKRTSEDPQTPNKYVKYSRRAWDGLIRKWRLQLHKYDES